MQFQSNFAYKIINAIIISSFNFNNVQTKRTLSARLFQEKNFSVCVLYTIPECIDLQ